MNSERCRWLTLACLMLSTAHAGDRNQSSATLSVLGDSNDNRQWLGKIAVPLGERAWAQGSFGRSEVATAGADDARIVGFAAGGGGKNISTAIEYVQRKGDAGFEQQNWAGTLDWHGTRGSVGADVSLRSAEATSTVRQTTGGVFGSGVTTTTVKESADGTGFGVHGDFVLTPRVIVSAGTMRYRYDFDARSTTTANNTPLSSLLGTTAATPGAWRDQAFVDRTYRIGGTYLLQRAAVSAQYFRDHVARSEETFSTVQLQAELPVADSWVLSPTVGYTAGGNAGHVSYGGVSVRFNW